MRRFDQAQANSTVEVQVGEPFIVELPETPTTGYRWQLTEGGSPGLRIVTDQFDPSGGGAGNSGMRHLAFVADRSLVATLSLELKRSWQPQPVQTFRVFIDAKPGP